MCGYFVETVIEPDYESVSDYVKHVKRNDPVVVDRSNFIEADYQCVCCGQKGPHTTGALLKFEDITPVTRNLSGKKGDQMWLCADCYHYGVRPLYRKFGDIRWNSEGTKIQNKAQDRGSHPWM